MQAKLSSSGQSSQNINGYKLQQASSADKDPEKTYERFVSKVMNNILCTYRMYKNRMHLLHALDTQQWSQVVNPFVRTA